jgi:hypothetical protein
LTGGRNREHSRLAKASVENIITTPVLQMYFMISSKV